MLIVDSALWSVEEKKKAEFWVKNKSILAS